MKKFTFLMIALLVASMSFAQVYLKNGRTAEKFSAKPTQTNLQKATRTVIFSENFDASSLDGWTTLDVDGDGYGWILGSACDGVYLDGGDLSGEGYNSSADLVTSGSFSNVSGEALTPDNWLITPAITLPETEDPIQMTFYVMAQDASYAAEHYGVYISTTGTETTDFTMLWEETMDGNGGTRAQGAWGEKNTNLTSYAGQTIHIAIRHFNCTDMFMLNFDEISISTISPCTTPIGLNTTDITYSGATLNWTGYTANFNVRYRTTAQDQYSFVDDFENGLDNWTILREDGGSESTDWRSFDPSNFSGGQTAHSGSLVAMSRSWASSAYTVDNWLISPQIALQGTLKYWVMDDGEYHENYNIYVSTASNAVADFELLYTPGNASDEWTEHTVDLSSYNGQMGYIAIRHNDTDQDFLLIDDFGIVTNTIAASDWTTVSATEATIALNNLEPNTMYEWQVQGVCEGSETTEWSSSAFFTTLLPTSIIEEVEDAISVYPNPTSSMITVANAEGKNIVVVNSLGQVVANIENAAANQTIDVANFANGTYFVKVDAEVVKLNVVK
ncbi:MAG: choice-of-anchor J domain-containing protein [Bacteroidales bacterium]|nr:choice-of-anchor J domain-containing protein [Bacteroidales bacterium]